jgi:hypothetical protein
VGGEEFNTFVNILLSLKTFANKQPREELLAIIAQQLSSDDFDVCLWCMFAAHFRVCVCMS